MDHKKCLANLLLYFGILHYFPRVASQIEATVGGTVSIQCRVTGTFTLPEWTFGLVPITNQGSPIINPAFTRLQYASDQKNLILTNAQLNDTGNYVCTHTLGSITTSLDVKETPTTTTTTTTTTASTTTTLPTTTTAPTASTTTAPTTTAPTTSTAPTTAGPTYNDEPLLTHNEKVIVIVVSCIIGVILILAVVIGIAANAQRKHVIGIAANAQRKRIKHRWSRMSSHGASRGHPMYHQDHLSERDLYDQDDIVYPYTTHQFGMHNRPYINQYIDGDDIYDRYKEVYHPYDRKSEPPHVHGSRNSHVTGEQIRKPQRHRDRHERRETHGLYPYTSYNRTYTQSSGELFYYGFSHNQSTHK